MKLEIKNAYLKDIIDLLFDLSLKGKESRHRSKLINLLNDRLKEVEEDRVELAKEHAEKDEEGEPVVEDKRYKIKDLDSFKDELNELFDEPFIIEGENNKLMLKTVSRALSNTDKEFSGAEAVIYNYLCEQLEKGEGKNDD